MFRLVSLFIVLVWCGVVWKLLDYAGRPPVSAMKSGSAALDWNVFFDKHLLNALPIADRFDFPVRPPDGDGAWIGRPFGDGGHAGEDWNTAAGDGDLNEPVYSPADGWVTLAMDFQGGWGKIILIDYRLAPGSKPPVVEMMFAHLATMEVQPYTFVKRGQEIGKMGNADGVYLAHLHWEVRNVLDLKLGGAYADDLSPWIAPSAFVAAHRGIDGAASKAQELPANQWDKWGGD